MGTPPIGAVTLRHMLKQILLAVAAVTVGCSVIAEVGQGVGAAGAGGASSEEQDAGVDAPSCLSPLDPGADVRAIGRVLIDGTTTGQLRPGAVNVGSVSLWQAEMTVKFAAPLAGPQPMIFAFPTSDAPVVTFVPTYVSYSVTQDGFKLMAFNPKGEPQSWETPTTIEPAIVVY